MWSSMWSCRIAICRCKRAISEVCRVLRASGHFVLADLRPAEEIPALREQLCSAGLRLVRQLGPIIVSGNRDDLSGLQRASFSLSKRGRGLDCAVPRGPSHLENRSKK